MRINSMKLSYCFVYGTAAQKSGNGGRGGDNGRGGSAGQIFIFKLSGGSFKYQISHKNGNNFFFTVLDNDLNDTHTLVWQGDSAINYTKISIYPI